MANSMGGINMAERVNFSEVEKYENLQTIVKLRKIIKKWWKLEVSFIDNRGFVLDHSRGKLVPPSNSFCKESLFCKDGLILCDKSVRELSEILSSGAYPRGCVFDGVCHLGFKMAAVPYYRDEKYMGAIFSCGFLTEKPSYSELKKINEKVCGYSKGVENLREAIGEISIINEGSLEYLIEFIKFGINEMESFRGELKLKEDEISDLNLQLRAKIEDIPLLIENFLKISGSRLKKGDKKGSSEAMDVPTKEMLSSEIKDGAVIPGELNLNGNLKEAVKSLEKRMILDGLKKCNWNKSKLSKELGISRASLIMKVNEYGFEKDCFIS